MNKRLVANELLKIAKELSSAKNSSNKEKEFFDMFEELLKRFGKYRENYDESYMLWGGLQQTLWDMIKIKKELGK